MRHTVTSEAGRPGMTLDQLQAAVEQARRSGARGDELIRARMYGRRGGLRSITLDLAEPAVAEPEPTAEAPQPNPPAARTRRR
ncbi:MAG TPA: hypothetical protein VIS06_00645 [Mycobacteriales bacterium]